MEEELLNLGEDVGSAFESLAKSGALRGAIDAIKARFDYLRLNRMHFQVRFQVIITSCKKREHETAAVFPIAAISTTESFPTDVKEDPEIERTLEKWQQGMSAMRYGIAFGAYPVRRVAEHSEVCSHCKGFGVTAKGK